MSKLIKLSDATSSSFLTNLAIVIGCGVSTVQVFSHTLFLEKYAEFFQLYKNGFEVDVPEDLETMLVDISDDLRIPVKNPVTKLQSVIGFDVMLFGSLKSTSGSIIGIPVSFYYKSKGDVDHASIQVANKSVPWDSEDGQRLEDSLVISDKAKKYAIAYELALADNNKIYFHGLCCPLAVLICGQVNNYFCNVFGLPFRPFATKGLFYSLLIMFGVGIFFAGKDMITYYYELEAHDKVCEGGEEYITGGIEFYEKLLLKQKALRNLLPGGKSDYNSNGDPIYWFRKKHVPPTILKSLTEQKLHQLKQSNPSADVA